MEAILASGKAEAAAIYDPDLGMGKEALKRAPNARLAESLADMLAMELDGVVIATPSALHADQCIEAFRAGTSVFCQKPLARNAAEVEAVIEAAREADKLLGVDFSYRHTSSM